MHTLLTHYLNWYAVDNAMNVGSNFKIYMFTAYHHIQYIQLWMNKTKKQIFTISLGVCVAIVFVRIDSSIQCNVSIKFNSGTKICFLSSIFFLVLISEYLFQLSWMNAVGIFNSCNSSSLSNVFFHLLYKCMMKPIKNSNSNKYFISFFFFVVAKFNIPSSVLFKWKKEEKKMNNLMHSIAGGK